MGSRSSGRSDRSCPSRAMAGYVEQAPVRHGSRVDALADVASIDAVDARLRGRVPGEACSPRALARAAPDDGRSLRGLVAPFRERGVRWAATSSDALARGSARGRHQPPAMLPRYPHGAGSDVRSPPREREVVIAPIPASDSSSAALGPPNVAAGTCGSTAATKLRGLARWPARARLAGPARRNASDSGGGRRVAVRANDFWIYNCRTLPRSRTAPRSRTFQHIAANTFAPVPAQVGSTRRSTTSRRITGSSAPASSGAHA